MNPMQAWVAACGSEGNVGCVDWSRSLQQRSFLYRNEGIIAGKFVIKKSFEGQFLFNLKTGNGETILTSELYKAKASAVNGIEPVKKNGALDERYERKIDKSRHPRFNLKAANGEIIGTS